MQSNILPSAGSLPTPKQCCRPGWNQECRSSIWVSHMNGKELSTWAITKYLAWNISRNLEQTWNNQDSNHTVRWDIDVPRSGLTNCATVVTLERAGNKWSSLKSLCVYKNLQTQDYKTIGYISLAIAFWPWALQNFSLLNIIICG